ncbi:sulfur carrier protein ThiS [Candidatus Nitrosacidococcus sp. I8]|uniref:sulfur carrier protein ThiS n=1 Tax=Candidatus Nitrosacidococcus sp. I8 TaxID=2942908 RepID=UPI0022271E8C|nr:sulfur carrier protein ThiS [Candidatus Nitrosacidococcus sp. I8]CAH9018180.1 hypothetical protein NURINAE_00777 [Candidatus Nitrosacidococcus sp. I8]
MEILLNGKPHQIPENCLLSDLVIHLNLQGKRIAIEVNQAIVPHSQYLHYTLHGGDKIEIVQAIGGG